MAKMGAWLTIGSMVIAGGLLVDNMRLRTQVAALETQVTAKATTPTGSRASTRTRPGKPKRARPAPPTRSPSEDVSQDDMDARIDSEVQTRLEAAVQAKLDQDLDSLVTERVEERIEQRREDRIEKHRAQMEEYISEFIAEAGHTEETETRLMTLFEGATANMGEVFRSIQSGEMERGSAREELQEIRDEVEASLEDILGSEEAERFQEDLRGPLGRRGPPR